MVGRLGVILYNVIFIRCNISYKNSYNKCIVYNVKKTPLMSILKLLLVLMGVACVRQLVRYVVQKNKFLPVQGGDIHVVSLINKTGKEIHLPG